MTEVKLNSQQHSDIWAKSHNYLRTAMVVLLVGLGAAVFWQIWRQNFDILGSVSAYYYTPAQAIFVGALIGLGACMIALKGTRPAEDVLLNLGGVFAALVAIVPTPRGKDHETAVAACKQAGSPLLTEKASTDLKCPTIQVLEDATRANVENNLFALLIVGALALLATVLFALSRRRSDKSVDRNESKLWSVMGFVAALAMWLAGLVAFVWYIDWIVDYGHYLTALGLLLCIFFVAVVNARRYREEQGDATSDGQTPGRSTEEQERSQEILTAQGNPGQNPDQQSQAGRAASQLARYRYTLIAWVMLIVTPIGIALVFVNAFALFWLEIVVAALFAAFWMVQTIEQLPARSAKAGDWPA